MDKGAPLPRMGKYFWVIASLVWLTAGQVQAKVTVVLERPFGYLVGDLVTQDVTFDGLHNEIDPASVPKPGYRTSWLYLREAVLSREAPGQRLRLTYQIMSSASDVKLIFLPALQLRARGGDERVGAVPITVSPIMNQVPYQRAGLGNLSADKLFSPPSATPALARLWWMLPLLLVLLALLLARQRFLRNAGQALPFNHARRQLQRLGKAPADEQSLLQAHRHIHRAFDATAGRSVFAENVAEFVERFPVFSRLNEEIDQFYASSRTVFFDESEANRLNLTELNKLAARLAGLERSSL